ncbi:MAG: helix-turn-helix domain-containing protein [Phycisphaeraceae bacterium]
MAGRKARECYGPAGQPTLLTEMPSIGTDAPQHASDRGLHPHRHAGVFELCLIARGSVEWWARREVYEVGPGHVYITKPDEPHGGVDAMLHPCELYWLTVRLPRSGRLPGMPRGDGTELAQRYHALRWRCFAGSAGLRDCFERLLAEHRTRRPLGRVAARAALHELLVTVLHDHEAHDQRQQDRAARRSAPIREALQWMDEHLSEEFGVEQIAARVGLGVSRFHERFRAEVGFTPAEWRMRQRVRRAKQLLREGDRPVTAVAMACGFTTSQYFATTFKRLVGLTPGQYRQRTQPR